MASRALNIFPKSDISQIVTQPESTTEVSDIQSPVVEESPEFEENDDDVIYVEPFLERTPSNWIITAAGDAITAYNSKSQEKFYGSIEEFNVRLRG